MNKLTTAIVALTLTCAQGSPYAQEPTIEVEPRPRFQISNLTSGVATVVIRVTSPYTPQNRAYCVIVDGPKFRASCMESHPTERTRKEFRYPELPIGSYGVEARVIWVDPADGKAKDKSVTTNFEIK